MKKCTLILNAKQDRNHCLVMNDSGEIVSESYKIVTPVVPKQGWLEYDSEKLWQSMYGAAIEALILGSVNVKDIIRLYVNNDSRTVVAWSAGTGKPVCNAIHEKCIRTDEYYKKLLKKGVQGEIERKTGLSVTSVCLH